MNIYRKGETRNIGRMLLQSEFDCKCSNPRCHYTLVSEKLMFNWTRLRRKFKKPIHVTSGFRCQSHNEEVGGVDKSYHTIGCAMDLIPSKHIDLDKFIQECEKLFDYTKIYTKKDDSFLFIHCHVIDI